MQEAPGRAESTLRLIHYDRPAELLPELRPGDPVQLHGLQGAADYNGQVAVFQARTTGGDGAPRFAVEIPAGRKKLAVRPANARRVAYEDDVATFPAHTDSGIITVAPAASVAGLEVKHFDGGWETLDRSLGERGYVVFVGDTLDYATGHTYRALLHRVQIQMQDAGRLSMPFFLRAGPRLPLPDI